MNRPAPYADNHLFEEIASWKARAEAAEAKLAGFDSPTAESVPPAVVEAMARAISSAVWDGSHQDRYLTQAQAALSSALATGSVVICSPDEKALIEDFRDLGSKDAGKMARLMELLPRYRAFVAARANSQEGK